VSGELRRFLESRQIEHTRGAPYHPMTQGKIERSHRSMKNLVQLQTFSSPWDLEQEISRFVDYYNPQRYHESLDNVTPADVYLGRAKEVQTRRQEIKRRTLEGRRQQHVETLKAAAHRSGRLAPTGRGLRPRAASPEGASGVSYRDDRPGRTSASKLGAPICLTLADTIHSTGRSSTRCRKPGC